MKLLLTTQIVDKTNPMLGFFHGWILEFAKYFDEVHIICLQKGKCDLPPNVYVYSLGKEEGENKLKYILRFYKYFWYIFFRVRVDHVFFHMGAIYNIMAAPFFFLRKFYKVQFSWWKTHGHLNLVNRLGLVFVDTVYSAIAESFPIKTDKLKVVGHAIDTELFLPNLSKVNNNKILFIGRFSRSKRLEQVLQITRQLLDQGVKVETKLIGMVTDIGYYKEIKQSVSDLNLKNHVTFVEGVPPSELVTEYQSAQLFINPSDNDGLDKVVLEAMLCGTIPLTANLSFEKVLTQFGLYMKKGDINGYTKAARSILEMDSTNYRELAEKLHDEVVKNHALNTLTKRIFNI